MKRSAITLFLTMALAQGGLCLADSSSPSGMPMVSPQVQQLFLSSMQTPSSPPPVLTSGAPAPIILPQDLRAALDKANNASANIDSQHAYHDKIKQYLQSQKH